MPNMYNLNLTTVNSFNMFDPELDGSSTSMSSSFSSSEFMAPITPTPYMSRRSSRCSEMGSFHNPSRPSSIISTSPTTPVDPVGFNLGSGIYGLGRSFTTDDDPFFDSVPVSHASSENFMESTSFHAMNAKQDSWDASQYLGQEFNYNFDALIAEGATTINTVFPDNNFVSGSHSITQDGHPSWPILGPQQTTIIPSQTLVEQPMTPGPRSTDQFHRQIKAESNDTLPLSPTFTNPFHSLDMTLRSGSSFPNPLNNPSLSSPRRTRKKSSVTLGRVCKSNAGIKQEPGFFSRNGRLLPYQDITERRRRRLDDRGRPLPETNAPQPKGFACKYEDQSGVACDRIFQRREHLTRHYQIHTGNPTPPCIFCKVAISANRQDNMKTHVEKTHIKASASGRRERYYTDPETKKTERITYELFYRLTGMDIRTRAKKK